MANAPPVEVDSWNAMVSPTARETVWLVSEQEVGALPEIPVVVEHVTVVAEPTVGEAATAWYKVTVI